MAHLPIDDEGMTIDPSVLEGARLVYVTPAHQFPLGVSMSLPRRLALLEWARAAGALIFEDDYDSEYRYSGRPVPALQGLDRHGHVLFAGSFSKVLFPSLRLAGLLEISGVEAGLQTVGWLCDGIDGHSAAAAASRRDVEVVPLSRYYRGTAAREGLQLGLPPSARRKLGAAFVSLPPHWKRN